MAVLLWCVAALFILLSIPFFMGKGAMMIAGYNLAGDEERNRYDEKALCRFMGKVMLSFAACFLLMSLSGLISSKAPLWTGLGLFFADCVFVLIYLNTGHRFQR